MPIEIKELRIKATIAPESTGDAPAGDVMMFGQPAARAGDDEPALLRDAAEDTAPRGLHVDGDHMILIDVGLRAYGDGFDLFA